MKKMPLLLKNLSSLVISHIITAVSGTLLLVYLARYLGEAEFGKYSFALSFSALFSILIGFGMNSYMIRELSRNKYLLNYYISNTSIFKIILSVAGFIVLYLMVHILNYSIDISYILYLFAAYTIIISFVQTFRSIFQSFELMEYEAFISTIEQILLVILISIGLISGFDLIFVASIYIFVSIILLILSMLIFYKKFEKFHFSFDFRSWKLLLLESIPFGLNSLFLVIFLKIDTIILFQLKGDVAVGIYNAAYNPLLALGIIPSILVTALYPTLSRYHISSKIKAELISSLFLKYTLIISIPITVGCLMLANRFIELFYGSNFSDSVIVFQILALFIPLRWMSNIYGVILTSINMQKKRTICLAICAIINIILNIILIPKFGYIGSSIATVISEFLLFLSFKFYISSNFKNITVKYAMIKSCFASLLLCLTLFSLGNANLIIPIALGFIVYVIVLLLIKAISKEDFYIINDFE